MNKSQQESRGFSTNYSGFKKSIRAKEKTMSDCDEGDRPGDEAYCGKSDDELRSALRVFDETKRTEELEKRLLALQEKHDQKQHNETVDLTKDTNPKDSVGVKKAPISTVSGAVMSEVGVAMLEGARKYGRHNYRVSGVRASVYRDAAWRHLTKWWEGEDIDPDSGISHIIKAMASLMVLRDAEICNMLTDDRPPRIPAGFWEMLDKVVVEVIAKYPNAQEAFTHKNTKDKSGLV